MERIFAVDEHVSLLGPGQPMLGPVPSGTTIVARTAPGCWGPMITPEIVGGHEVTQPIAIEGAVPGDALAIKIRRIRILSLAAMSGVDRPVEGRFENHAAIAARCPKCGTMNPRTVLEGTGPDAVRCAICGAPANPFQCVNGYTMIFDTENLIGLTVPKSLADHIAARPHQFAALPAGAKQNPATVMGAADLVGVWARLRPFVGNIGTSPAVTLPAASNSQDIAARMVGAPHRFAVKKEDVPHVTESHLDSDQLRPGAILIMPVELPGGGFYMGDVHAVQGDGEIAGHTVDVSAEVIVEVRLLKAVRIEGAVLLPNREDLPSLVRPLDPAEQDALQKLAERLRVELEGPVLPIQVIGTGMDLNGAIKTALERMSGLTGMKLDEVRNRCTITGSVDISRLGGVVQLSMLVPCHILDKAGIGDLAREMYI